MKQLTYLKPNLLKWEEVPEPILTKENDASVSPFLVARCDIDAAFLRSDIFKRISIGRFLGLVGTSLSDFARKDFLKGPFPFGHECVAEIVALEKGVRNFKLRQKVIIPFQISCGVCPICESGLSSPCQETGSFNMYSGIGKHVSQGGTLSDILKVPYANKMLIPAPMT